MVSFLQCGMQNLGQSLWEHKNRFKHRNFLIYVLAFRCSSRNGPQNFRVYLLALVCDVMVRCTAVACMLCTTTRYQISDDRWLIWRLSTCCLFAAFTGHTQPPTSVVYFASIGTCSYITRTYIPLISAFTLGERLVCCLRTYLQHVCLDVYMYVWPSHIARVWINRVRLPICSLPAEQKKADISLSSFAPKNLVSRYEFGIPALRQPAHLHAQVESGSYSRDSCRVPRRRPFVYLNRHTPSGPSRVCRVTQLRTDSVHCRKTANTGPVYLEVVPNSAA